MNNKLRFDIAERPITYAGLYEEFVFDDDRLIEFNHRHRDALANYDLTLDACTIITMSRNINKKSNLGALRNRKLRQSVILAAGLSAIAVGLNGRGSLNKIPKDKQTKDLINQLKRVNDRNAAQVMSEVLQSTTEKLPVGEEALIESTITEGARPKPGKEPGGNPTIAVGAVFGKEDHQAQYGLTMPTNVSLLSMGSDVVEGTTKSVMGIHSSMTALFVTESGVKRHLPDIYVQRWASGAWFGDFNPREVDVLEAANIIAKSYGLNNPKKLSAFFLDRNRHYPAMDRLNKAGISTPYDQDGDLLPLFLCGLDGIVFPDGRNLNSMIGEIGGSAEWAIGVLPLVWRGGQAIGMLTSQSSLTNKNLTAEEKWKERFHFTEEEFIMIQDARFERKPYFTISDIVENPFAGGISAFGAITDNCFIPFIKGVEGDFENNRVIVNVLVINSLGMVECWRLVFKANQGLNHSISLMTSPKERLRGKTGKELEKTIAKMLADPHERQRFRIFFNNEYYPAIIPVRDKMVLLHKAVHGLIKRRALMEYNQGIIDATEKLAHEWFINSD